MKNGSRRVIRPLLTLMLAMHMTAAHAEDAPQAIANAMPGTNISSTSATVIEGLYEVVAGDNVLYVDASGRYLVIGSIYDLQDDVDLSAERRAQVTTTSATTSTKAPNTPLSSLPLTAAITTGDGDRALTIVTDPQCSWCRRLWIESLESLEGTTVRHLLLNPSAQAVGILCAKNPGKALSEAFDIAVTTAKTPVPSARCGRLARAKIARVQAFAEAIGMLGTPILIRDDGAVHAGYLGRAELLNWLGGSSDET